MKYRIWDKKINKYADDVYVQPNGNIRHFVYYEFMEDGYEENYIVELSTGLLDKNGVEIYEGDIVKYVGNMYNCELAINNPIVRYSTKSCSFKLCIEYLDYGKSKKKKYYALTNKCEIIGNIHDTPREGE
jgi:uncharacterized phage protein (TIGR01671 family)